jgi:hypothetical protein
LERERDDRRCRKLHNEVHNFCSSPHIIRVNKSKRIRWEEHIARKGEMRNTYKILIENLKRIGHLEDLGVSWTKL